MTPRLFLFCCLLCQVPRTYAQAKKDSSVTQTIVYKTKKAADVYLVWAVNNWQEPTADVLPSNTTINKQMAWTKMAKDQGSFAVSLTLPKNTYLNYMIWVPVDAGGDSTDGWDTYGDIMYSSTFDKEQRIVMDDHALWIPDNKPRFNILKSGKTVLLSSLAISLLLASPFIRRRSISCRGFAAGILIGALVLSILVRAEMNELFNEKIGWAAGAMIQDLLVLSITGLLFFGSLYLARHKRWISIAITSFFSLAVLVYCLYEILNIEIVRQLGRPLNYQWLYYSDFMRGVDAKNAMAYNLSGELRTNIAFALAGVLVLSLAFSFWSAKALKKLAVVLPLATLLMLITGFVEKRSFTYEEKNTANPIVELVGSAYSANNKPQLFSMHIPDSTRQYVESIHNVPAVMDSSLGINNIVLFVLESTPKNVIGFYNDSFKVTPNLQKWGHIATRFENMYAHIPSTPNSMISMVAGIYPMLTYKSLLQEAGGQNLPALPNELRRASWTTSFFSSSDLTFGEMDSFAVKSGFETVADSRGIKCSRDKFRVTNSSLDGLDDRCISEQYLQWVDTRKSQRRYAMLWTNQTHYPYFFDRDKEVHYSENAELNHYLNALKQADEAFGILMSGLEERKMLEHTMVIVVGDHGEAFGSHNQFSHASHIYEENVHIPAIIYCPALGGNKVDSRNAGMIDIPVTIASVAGIQKPAGWQGRSLLAREGRKESFFVCPYSDFLFGLRDGKWKYIYNATRNKQELYDLASDPQELHNVASKHPEIIRKEYELLAAWVQYHNKRIDAILDRRNGLSLNHDL